MNDRFKFRAWYKPNYREPIMLYDVEQTYDYMNGEPESVPAGCFGDVLDDKAFIVMQCTGLKDKNGKLLYEGDIVEAKHKPDREGWYCVWRGVVQYDNQNCQYVLKASHYSVLNETKLNKATFENNESFNWFDWLEVIGNIYENKECE